MSTTNQISAEKSGAGVSCRPFNEEAKLPNSGLRRQPAPHPDRSPQATVAVSPAPPAYQPQIQPQVLVGRSPLQIHPGLSGELPSGSAEPIVRRPFDVAAIRSDFPILRQRVKGWPLVWLDNGSTTQKPSAVIDRLARFYSDENSNVHRAAHELAARATGAYDEAREKIRRFLNAGSARELVFVRGTTEAINLVAATWGETNIGSGEEIVVSHLEHHANIVPWQMLCARRGAQLRVIPVDDDGQIRLDEYRKLLNARTKLVALTQVSNALGTVTPVRQMVDLARQHGAKVLVDGAQAVAHTRVDLQELGCDFYAFSGHKLFGPTGIGLLCGRRQLLGDLPPWQGGGSMTLDVTFEKTVCQPTTARFEAGTGSIGDAVALGAAIDYLEEIGMDAIASHERDLLLHATDGLRTIPGVRLIGTARHKAPVISFTIEGLTNERVGQALDAAGIAVRAGHHCAQPILRRFGVEGTVRLSFALYNTREEVDRTIGTIARIAA
ncbi:MAG: cysteine desulfurase [Acidobacteria bacterium]|nr:cysteine desulfurase [Acidobacteriota bacterium]